MMNKNTVHYYQDKPRAIQLLTIECHIADELMQPWDKLTEKQQDEFELNGPIPCEGSGDPGVWCQYCRFGEIEYHE